MMANNLYSCTVKGVVTDMTYVVRASSILEAVEIVRDAFPLACGYDVRLCHFLSTNTLCQEEP